MPRELAQLLLDEGVVDNDGVERALARQREAGGALDTALLELGVVAEGPLTALLARASDLPPAPLSAYEAVDARARRVFPSKVAERHGLAPFALDGRELSLVATHPLDLGLLDEISFMLSLHLTPHVGPEWRVRSLIQRLYGGPLPARLARLADGSGGLAPAPAPEVPSPTSPVEASEPDAATPPPAPARPPRPLGISGFGRAGDEPLEPLAAALAQAAEAFELDWEAEALASPLPAAGRVTLSEPSPTPSASPPLPPAAQAAPPPPPARRLDRSAPPRWTVAAARAVLAEATSRDEVVLAVLRYARDFFQYAALFAVTRDAVAGHDALGQEDGTRDVVRTVALYVTDPGFFRTTLDTLAPFLGPVSRDAVGSAMVLDGLGRGTPRTTLVYPILLRGRPICILYADNGQAPVSARRLGDLLVFLSQAGGAFERIIRARKGEPRPGAGASQEVEAPSTLEAPAVHQPEVEVGPATLETPADSAPVEPEVRPPLEAGVFVGLPAGEAPSPVEPQVAIERPGVVEPWSPVEPGAGAGLPSEGTLAGAPSGPGEPAVPPAPVGEPRLPPPEPPPLAEPPPAAEPPPVAEPPEAGAPVALGAPPAEPSLAAAPDPSLAAAEGVSPGASPAGWPEQDRPEDGAALPEPTPLPPEPAPAEPPPPSPLPVAPPPPAPELPAAPPPLPAPELPPLDLAAVEEAFFSSAPGELPASVLASSVVLSPRPAAKAPAGAAPIPGGEVSISLDLTTDRPLPPSPAPPPTPSGEVSISLELTTDRPLATASAPPPLSPSEGRAPPPPHLPQASAEVAEAYPELPSLAVPAPAPPSAASREVTAEHALRPAPVSVPLDPSALVGTYLVSPRGSDERVHLLGQLVGRAGEVAPILCEQLPGPLDAAPEVLAATAAPDQGPVLAAVAALGPAALKPLLAMLADPAPERRRAAVALLGQLGDGASFLPLAERCFDPAPPVAEAARVALSLHRRDPAMRPVPEKLRRALLSGLADKAAGAARAISALRDAESIPLLIQALEGSDASTAAAAADALAVITLQRHGTRARDWLMWWKQNRGRTRADWLFGALTSGDRELRLLAANELREVAASPVAYSADLPAAELQAAAQAWQRWFTKGGHRP